jgi:hypothetical protein
MERLGKLELLIIVKELYVAGAGHILARVKKLV